MDSSDASSDASDDDDDDLEDEEDELEEEDGPADEADDLDLPAAEDDENPFGSSDDDAERVGPRGTTGAPDLAKLTARQRAAYTDSFAEPLMMLPEGASSPLPLFSPRSVSSRRWPRC